MKKKILEESVLFVSIIKWLLLATFAGVVVGASTAAFLKLLHAGSAYAASFKYYFLILPVSLFLSSFVVRYLAPDAVGHGTEKIIEAVHKYAGRIKPLVVPVKLLATIVTISTGGSAGKEGPAAQIGAGLCSVFSDLFKFDERDRKKMVICGISAGFASVFGTPIAGAIFGVEVLFVGGLLYEVLLPSFVAGIVSFQVSSALGVTYFQEPLFFIPVFSGPFFAKVCLSGLFFGLCSLLFIEALHFFDGLSDRVKVWNPFKGVIGGVALVVLALIFSTRYLGLGLETIKGALEGNGVPMEASLVKMLFTAITLSFGGSGGIVTPIFFVGATSGNAFGTIFGFEPTIFAAIGMVSVLAGAANTPISASIMSVELFGPEVAPYAAVACVISFLMTGHRSVYPSQVLSVVKSASLMVRQGQEMKDIEEVEFQPRSKTIGGKIAVRFKNDKKGKPSK